MKKLVLKKNFLLLRIYKHFLFYYRFKIAFHTSLMIVGNFKLNHQIKYCSIEKLDLKCGNKY